MSALNLGKSVSDVLGSRLYDKQRVLLLALPLTPRALTARQYRAMPDQAT